MTELLEFQNFLHSSKKRKIGPTALKWVALVYDYESPYRHYSESERVKAVSKDLYDTYNWKGVKDAALKVACDKYNELQFDPLDEQLIAFNKKINQFTALIDGMHLDEENAEMLQKLMIGVEKDIKNKTVVTRRY